MHRDEAQRMLQHAAQQAGITEEEAMLMAAEILFETANKPTPKISESALSDEEDGLLTEMGMAPADNAMRLEAKNNMMLAATQRRLLQDALSVAEAAELLDVTPNRLRQRIRARTLIGVKAGRHPYVLPRFQFSEYGGEVPHLQDVLEVIWHEVPPFVIMEFFETPTAELDEDNPISPRDHLLSLRPPEPVLRLAREL